MLHITNGDMAVQALVRAGVSGPFLPWRDLLHVGPVPAGLTLAELSARRAAFIAGQGWAPLEGVRQDFAHRDQVLSQCRGPARLWFESDLYDQLQLLQILTCFHQREPVPDLELVQLDGALGSADPVLLASLPVTRVTPAQLRLAATAWSAFGASEPGPLVALLDQDLSALPFLAAALERFLEDYPHPADGLPRSQRQMLACLADQSLPVPVLFRACQGREARPFMADTVFGMLLQQLLDARLIQGGAALALTPLGQRLLAGQGNWLALHRWDQWHGGVHLRPGQLWSWDPATRELSPLADPT